MGVEGDAINDPAGLNRVTGYQGAIVKNWIMGPLSLAIVLVAGCDSAYYKTMEAFGHQKREILVDRVKKARDSQEQAKEQFASALEKFGSVVNYEGGKLETLYKQLNSELEASRSKAKAVGSRIADVEDVAAALFKEWESELDQYSDADLKRSSQAKLDKTRQRYEQLIAAMRRAESKMAPVLTVFGDQVLFLKHNLNAQAVASLEDELVSVETDVAALIKDMEASIAEANAFIDAMGAGQS